MRNVILVEKIIELTTVARIVRGQDAQARKIRGRASNGADA